MKDLKINKNFWHENIFDYNVEQIGNRNSYFDIDVFAYDSFYETLLNKKIDFENTDIWYSASISLYPRKKNFPVHILLWDSNYNNYEFNVIGPGKNEIIKLYKKGIFNNQCN